MATIAIVVPPWMRSGSSSRSKAMRSVPSRRASAASRFWLFRKRDVATAPAQRAIVAHEARDDLRDRAGDDRDPCIGERFARVNDPSRDTRSPSLERNRHVHGPQT